MEEKIGFWEEDALGLPAFRYTGALPCRRTLRDGTAAKLPEDPWFLLGNPQLTLFCHVSGVYDLLTGQRAWGQMNMPLPGEEPAGAVLDLSAPGNTPCRTVLTGRGSPAWTGEGCSRFFGCGFARWEYCLPGLRLTRDISAAPADRPDGGVSAFLITVTVENTGTAPVSVRYEESLPARYGTLEDRTVPAERRSVRYRSELFSEDSGRLLGVRFSGQAEDPLLCPDPETPSRAEGFPPALFLWGEEAAPSIEGDRLSAACSVRLEAGGTGSFRFAAGFTFGEALPLVRALTAPLSRSAGPGPVSAYGEAWRDLLPALEDEQDPVLRREMRWHAYVLEAMATYSAYFKETKIPQGTSYDYWFGSHASVRDNCQHALPLCTWDPPLARSALRYLLKRTAPTGEIRLSEVGYAFAENGVFFPSDQQLWFFMLLSEYLRATEDYGFLGELAEPYPVRGMAPVPVWSFCERAFLFLRDVVGRGEHSLVRLLNSDWNDAVYYMVSAPYNSVIFSGESHMNTAMALAVFPDLIRHFREGAKLLGGEAAVRLSRLCESMEQYRASLSDAFFRDLGDRTFPRRMYFAGKAYGEENLFLEPQGFTLQIPELSENRRRSLLREVLARNYEREALGGREQQSPQFGSEGQERGSRENGGFWWALNGPIILGAALTDPGLAWSLLRRMTLDHASSVFPDLWTVRWSAADNLESSLMPGEGMADQSWVWAEAPVFCAHPHAWLLYCYTRLRELST